MRCQDGVNAAELLNEVVGGGGGSVEADGESHAVGLQMK